MMNDSPEPTSSYHLPVVESGKGKKAILGSLLGSPTVTLAADNNKTQQRTTTSGRRIYEETAIPGTKSHYDSSSHCCYQSAILHPIPGLVLEVPPGMSCDRDRGIIHHNATKQEEKTTNATTLIHRKWRNVPGNRSKLFKSIGPSILVIGILCFIAMFLFGIDVDLFCFVWMMTGLLAFTLPTWFSSTTIEITSTQLSVQQVGCCGKTTSVEDLSVREEEPDNISIMCKRDVWKQQSGKSNSSSSDSTRLVISYQVLMKHPNGTYKLLVEGLETAEMALFIQQEIERLRFVKGGPPLKSQKQQQEEEEIVFCGDDFELV